MNKHTTIRLTDAEIHQLKYPKAQIVDVDIYEDKTLSEQDIMAMVDQQHLNTRKKALGRTMELSIVIQNAEEARKGLINFDLRAHPTIEDINSCIRICERAIEVIAPAIAVADELNVLYECNLGLHPKKIEEGKSIRAALIECKKFFEGEIKKLNWPMSFVESANASHSLETSNQRSLSQRSRI